MREQHATHGMGKSGELGPPIAVRLRNVEFGQRRALEILGRLSSLLRQKPPAASVYLELR
jgi:hypothetical protein